MATPLPLPDDGRIRLLIDAWNHDPAQFGLTQFGQFPRSVWLNHFESVLREHYPQASSDELTLTARNAAPFHLALPNVP